MVIDGQTKIVGLIGYPIGHTLSPAMHNAAFRELGLNFIYLPFEVLPDNLGAAIKGMISLGIVGLNVTIPHKVGVMEYLDELSDEARMIGAVNTIYKTDGRLRGDNTDGRGFLNALIEAGVEVVNKRIFIFGAGGAGRACAFMLAKEGVQRIILTDKIINKAGSLDKDLTERFHVFTEVISLDDERMRDYIWETDLIINATPVGMNSNDELLINPEWLHKDMIVYDLIYNPRETALLRAATEKGAKVINGMGMLVHQGALSFELWTGKKAPLGVMRLALEEALGR